jgi:(p)ppGpp synthase/HD superfamily hydrolase
MTENDLEAKFEELVDLIKQYNPDADIPKLNKAWEFAKLAHTGQKRLSGEYFMIRLKTVEQPEKIW